MATFIRNISSDNLDTVLLCLTQPENKQQEMMFSNNVIETICKECQYPCYQFAHNLNGDILKRVRMWPKNITFEYIVMKNLRTQDYDAYVHHIYQNGQLVYRRPDNPIGTIRVL